MRSENYFRWKYKHKLYQKIGPEIFLISRNSRENMVLKSAN